MWEVLIDTIAPVIITFLMGLFLNKPGYKKAKNANKLLEKIWADDKVTPDEWAEIKNFVNSKK